MKRILVLPAVGAVVLALAGWSIARTQPRLEVHPPPVDPPRSGFARPVAGVGLVEASSENVSLSAHVPGVVEKVLVKAGQEVRAGEALVKLDTRALEAAHRERHAEVAAREAAATAAKARARKARAGLADVQRTLGFAESVTNPRSISAEELTRRRSAVEIARAEVESADADVGAADAAVGAARAALAVVETDIDRCTIRSPIDGRILQLRIRAGEYAVAGPAAAPWLVVGSTNPLHLRVDIDEQAGWRVEAGARAEAQVRGQPDRKVALTFVRFEPLVVPKQSLTGSSQERVDTRVLQAVYRIAETSTALFVGQQMDVFIESRL